ncbi:unnamed protein product, partial [Amoebophrya sp. A120]
QTRRGVVEKNDVLVEEKQLPSQVDPQHQEQESKVDESDNTFTYTAFSSSTAQRHPESTRTTKSQNNNKQIQYLKTLAGKNVAFGTGAIGLSLQPDERFKLVRHLEHTRRVLRNVFRADNYLVVGKIYEHILKTGVVVGDAKSMKFSSNRCINLIPFRTIFRGLVERCDARGVHAVPFADWFLEKKIGKDLELDLIMTEKSNQDKIKIAKITKDLNAKERGLYENNQDELQHGAVYLPPMPEEEVEGELRKYLEDLESSPFLPEEEVVLPSGTTSPGQHQQQPRTTQKINIATNIDRVAVIKQGAGGNSGGSAHPKDFFSTLPLPVVNEFARLKQFQTVEQSFLKFAFPLYLVEESQTSGRCLREGSCSILTAPDPANGGSFSIAHPMFLHRDEVVGGGDEILTSAEQQHPHPRNIKGSTKINTSIKRDVDFIGIATENAWMQLLDGKSPFERQYLLKQAQGIVGPETDAVLLLHMSRYLKKARKVLVEVTTTSGNKDHDAGNVQIEDAESDQKLQLPLSFAQHVLKHDHFFVHIERDLYTPARLASDLIMAMDITKEI